MTAIYCKHGEFHSDAVCKNLPNFDIFSFSGIPEKEKHVGQNYLYNRDATPYGPFYDPSRYRRKAKHKQFGGGGVLGAPDLQTPSPPTEPRNPETPKVHFKVRKMPF